MKGAQQRAVGGAPQPRCAIPPPGDNRLSVGREGHATHIASVPPEGAQQRAIGGAPHPHLSIFRGGGYRLSVGGKGHATDAPASPPQHPHERATGEIKQVRGVVGCCGSEGAPIRGKGDIQHGSRFLLLLILLVFLLARAGGRWCWWGWLLRPGVLYALPVGGWRAHPPQADSSINRAREEKVTAAPEGQPGHCVGMAAQGVQG